MDGKLIILGCGGSAGVPAIGNWWGNCDPKDPRNRRTRPSVALKTDSTLLIVDTGPDFSAQMNRENLDLPDAVIITHAHSDHVNGIDELRVLQQRHKDKFSIYAVPETLEELQTRVGYMFKSKADFYPAVCDAVPLALDMPLTIGDITFTPFEQDHGTIKSLGVRIGNVAYCTDVKRIENSSLDILKGVETWIIDGGGYHSQTNPVHATIEEILAMNETVGAKKVILTHLPATMDYLTLTKELPDNFSPAYDGMVIDFIS